MDALTRRLYWLISFIFAFVTCSATGQSYCGSQHRPALNVCQKGNRNYTDKVYIDTVGIPRSQAVNCSCSLTRVDNADLDVYVNLTLLDSSYMPNGERFQINNVVINSENLHNCTHINSEELRFIKHDSKNWGGACLRITTDVPVNIFCKPQRLQSEPITTTSSVVSVARPNHTTHQIPENVSANGSSWCGTHKPKLNMCQEGNHQNIMEVYIDTMGIPKSQASYCTCILTKVNIGDFNTLANLSLLNTSYMPCGERFQLEHYFVNQHHTNGDTFVNYTSTLQYIKPGNNDNSGACLRVTIGVPMNIVCKSQTRFHIETTTVNPSADHVIVGDRRDVQVIPQVTRSTSGIVSATGSTWCRRHKPVLNVCQQRSHNNTTEVFIDTGGIPIAQESNCTCSLTKVNIGDLDTRVTLTLLDTSSMPNDERFLLRQIVVNNNITNDSIHINDPQFKLRFIKPGDKNDGGACLRIKTDVPVNIVCKPQTIFPGKTTTVNPSAISVTQEKDMTHQIPDDSSDISAIAIPIGVGLVVFLLVLSVVITLTIICKRRKKKRGQHNDTDVVREGGIDDTVNPIHRNEDETARKGQQEYEYIDSVECVTKAAVAKSALNKDTSADHYDYTALVEISSSGATEMDPSDSTYDSAKSTRPGSDQKYTDNIYNKLQGVRPDTGSYSSTNTVLCTTAIYPSDTTHASAKSTQPEPNQKYTDNIYNKLHVLTPDTDDTYNSAHTATHIKNKNINLKPDDDYSVLEIK